MSLDSGKVKASVSDSGKVKAKLRHQIGHTNPFFLSLESFKSPQSGFELWPIALALSKQKKDSNLWVLHKKNTSWYQIGGLVYVLADTIWNYPANCRI